MIKERMSVFLQSPHVSAKALLLTISLNLAVPILLAFKSLV